MNNLLDFLSRHYHWFLFALLEVISVVLLFQYNSYQGSTWVNSSNAVAGLVYETDASIEHFFSLVKVNEQLTQRNLYLEQQVQTLSSQIAKQANDSSFMRMAGVKMLEHYHIIPAKVVSNSVSKLDNLITINKGAADGVRKDMGVASGVGAVGIVYLTGIHYSVVLPLLNSHSSLSCSIKSHGYFGYLHWDGKDPQYAYLDDVPRHAKVSVKDTVVTSGYSSVFPPGVQVGRVTKIMNSPDGLSYRCLVKLSTDFGHLNDVCVIDDKMMRERLDVLRAAQDSMSNSMPSR